MLTKQEALRKIEELKKYVTELDEQQQLKHGDMVDSDQGYGQRIVVKMSDLLRNCSENYAMLDRDGWVMNSFDNVPDTTATYTKDHNVFGD